MAVRVVYTWKDDKGKTATTEVKAPSNISLVDLTEFAVDMANLIGVLTTGGIQNISLCLDVDISLISAPLRVIGALSDVEEKGFFQFVTVNGFPTKMQIPTFDEGKVQAGSNQIDQTDADVAAFVTAMESGITTTTNATLVQPSDSREEDIVQLQIAEEVFRG